MLSEWRGTDVCEGELVGLVKIENNIIKRGHNSINRTKYVNDDGSISYDFGNEITYEQFLQHVLKQPVIVGYKAPIDMFGGKVKAGTIYKKRCGGYDYGVDGKLVNGFGVVAEIVETWEPVYAGKFKIGDWVRWKGFKPCVGRIVGYCPTFGDSWQLEVEGNFKTHSSCYEKLLEHATSEEIVAELVKLSYRINDSK